MCLFLLPQDAWPQTHTPRKPCAHFNSTCACFFFHRMHDPKRTHTLTHKPCAHFNSTCACFFFHRMRARCHSICLLVRESLSNPFFIYSQASSLCHFRIVCVFSVMFRTFPLLPLQTRLMMSQYLPTGKKGSFNKESFNKESFKPLLCVISAFSVCLLSLVSVSLNHFLCDFSRLSYIAP